MSLSRARASLFAVFFVAFVAQAVLAPELLVLAGLGDLVSDIAAGSLRLTVALDPTLRTIARAGEPCVAWDAAHATHALLFDESNRLCRCEVVGDELPALDRTRVVRAIDAAGSARAVPLSAIELTDEQKKEIKTASGQDVIALELNAEKLEERVTPIIAVLISL